MNPMRHGRSLPLATPTLILMSLVAIWASPALALDGDVRIHDPSTVVPCEGKFYTYGTGGSCLVSDDGWTWRRGVRPSRSGMALVRPVSRASRSRSATTTASVKVSPVRAASSLASRSASGSLMLNF